MDNSQSPYAQLLASSSLLKVITDHTLRYEPPHGPLLPHLGMPHFDIFLSHAILCSVPVKLEMRNYFMAYLDR